MLAFLMVGLSVGRSDSSLGDEVRFGAGAPPKDGRMIGHVGQDISFVYVNKATTFFDEKGAQITPKQFDQAFRDGGPLRVVYSRKDERAYIAEAIYILPKKK